jgi:hypothetical protein
MPRRQALVTMALCSAFLCCSLPDAGAAVNDIYALDIARTSPPSKLIKVDPVTFGQVNLNLVAGLPAPELPMNQPVGIDVDESAGANVGTVFVAVSEGYAGNYRFTPAGTPVPCTNGGCGALLRVDPSNPNAATTTVISGPSTEGDDNFWENPYDVLWRPGANDVLVSDNSTTRLISVNPANGNQTIFSKTAAGDPDPGGGLGGMRAPWSIARDPTNGDILVVNTGVGPFNSTGGPCQPDETIHTYCRFDPSQFSDIDVPDACNDVPAGHLTDPPQPGEVNHGFILRLSSTGQHKQLYCSKNLIRPRDIAVDSNGTIFVTDPMAIKVNPNVNDPAAVGYGVLFEINPDSGAVSPVEPLSAGSSFATPSGLDFTPTGGHLLLSDETLFPFQGPCVNGCGGLIDVKPDGGQQTVVSSRTVPSASSNYLDPIDVTVDRGGSSPPSVGITSVPRFLDPSDTRVERQPTSNGARVTSLPLLPIRSGSRVTLVCLEAGCTQSNGHQLSKEFPVPPGQTVTQIDPTVTYFTCAPGRTLSGQQCLFCPKGYKLKGTTLCLKKKKKRRRKPKARTTSAGSGSRYSAQAIDSKKSGKKHPHAEPADSVLSSANRIQVADSPLAANPVEGRYFDFVVNQTTIAISHEGCTTSATQIDLLTPIGEAVCPP